MSCLLHIWQYFFSSTRSETMPGSRPSRQSYITLESSDKDERSYQCPQGPHIRRTKWTLYHVITLFCISIVCLAVGFASTILIKGFQERQTRYSQQPNSCTNPPLRREWRSLARVEKDKYIQAVKCLKTIPSRLGLNQTLYDDFPWVHSNFGEYCTLYRDTVWMCPELISITSSSWCSPLSCLA